MNLVDVIETVDEDNAAAYADAAIAAGFVFTGNAHTTEDRRVLVETLCGVDPDYADYPDYVQDGTRKEVAGAAEAILSAGYGRR